MLGVARPHQAHERLERGELAGVRRQEVTGAARANMILSRCRSRIMSSGTGRFLDCNSSMRSCRISAWLRPAARASTAASTSLQALSSAWDFRRASSRVGGLSRPHWRRLSSRIHSEPGQLHESHHSCGVTLTVPVYRQASWQGHQHSRSPAKLKPIRCGHTGWLSTAQAALRRVCRGCIRPLSMGSRDRAEEHRLPPLPPASWPRGHTSHWTRPSSVRCQYLVAAVPSGIAPARSACGG